VIQAFLKKQEKSQINNLTHHLKECEKEEQIKPKVSRRKEIKIGCSGGLVAKLCLTLVTLWTVAPQAPLSTGFPRQ